MFLNKITDAFNFVKQKMTDCQTAIQEKYNKYSFLFFASAELKEAARKVENNGLDLLGLNHEFRNHPLIIERALNQNPYAIGLLDDNYKGDRGLVERIVGVRGRALVFVIEGLKNDKGIVGKAADQDVEALQDASQELRNDETLMIGLIKKNTEAWKYASPRLQNGIDRVTGEVNLEAFDVNDTIRANREVIQEILTVNGFALEFAHSDIKNDIVLATLAVRTTPKAMAFVSDRLRNNIDFFLEFAEDDTVIEFMGDDIKSNEELLLRVIAKNASAIGFGNEDLVENRDFIIKALQVNEEIFNWLDAVAVADKAIAIAFVQKKGMNLEHLSDEQKDDFDIVAAAIAQNPLAIVYASENVQDLINEVDDLINE